MSTPETSSSLSASQAVEESQLNLQQPIQPATVPSVSYAPFKPENRCSLNPQTDLMSELTGEINRLVSNLNMYPTDNAVSQLHPQMQKGRPQSSPTKPTPGSYFRSDPHDEARRLGVSGVPSYEYPDFEQYVAAKDHTFVHTLRSTSSAQGYETYGQNMSATAYAAADRKNASFSAYLPPSTATARSGQYAFPPSQGCPADMPDFHRYQAPRDSTFIAPEVEMSSGNDMIDLLPLDDNGLGSINNVAPAYNAQIENFPNFDNFSHADDLTFLTTGSGQALHGK